MKEKNPPTDLPSNLVTKPETNVQHLVSRYCKQHSWISKMGLTLQQLKFRLPFSFSSVQQKMLKIKSVESKNNRSSQHVVWKVMQAYMCSFRTTFSNRKLTFVFHLSGCYSGPVARGGAPSSPPAWSSCDCSCSSAAPSLLGGRKDESYSEELEEQLSRNHQEGWTSYWIRTDQPKKTFHVQRNAMLAFLKFPLTVQTSENSVPLSPHMIHDVKTLVLRGYGGSILDLAGLMKTVQNIICH